MSTPLIPIAKVRLATKSNKVLKAYLDDNIIRKNGEEYCTVKDSLRGIAAIGEKHAYVDYWNEETAPTFRTAGFGLVNSESKTVPLIIARRKVLNAPLEALKDPSLLVGRKFPSKDGSYYSRITSAHMTDKGNLYVAYGLVLR